MDRDPPYRCDRAFRSHGGARDQVAPLLLHLILLCARCDGRPAAEQIVEPGGTIRVRELGDDVADYLSLAKHRHNAANDANKWGQHISADRERRIFSNSRVESWADDEGHYWGACDGLALLGVDPKHRYAKFPKTSNDTDDRHGYPVSARDRRREVEHTPPNSVVTQWEKMELISRREAIAIMRRKI